MTWDLATLQGLTCGHVKVGEAKHVFAAYWRWLLAGQDGRRWFGSTFGLREVSPLELAFSILGCLVEV